MPLLEQLIEGGLKKSASLFTRPIAFQVGLAAVAVQALPPP
jgi:hypothetical protein